MDRESRIDVMKKKKKNERGPNATERRRLEKIYFDPKRGFKGIDSLRRITGLPISVIRTFLRGTRSYTLHAPARRTHDRRPVDSGGFLYSQMGTDLMDLPKLAPRNDGFRYIMVCICQVSKRAHARGLKTKDSAAVKKAFGDIIDTEIAPLTLRMIHGDKERAFVSEDVKSFLRDRYNVTIFAVGNAQTKCAAAERVIRTLKNMMFRYMTHFETDRYIDDLQNLIENYNSTWHRSIRMAPKDVSEENVELAWANAQLTRGFAGLRDDGGRSFRQRDSRPKARFRVGDTVRTSFVKNLFDKGYTPNYTETVYAVSEVVDHGLMYAYKLRDAFDDTKEPLEGEFYAWELIAAEKPDTFIIEDILDLKTIRGKTFGLTKWLGYDKKDSEWRQLTDDEMGSLGETTAGKARKERDDAPKKDSGRKEATKKKKKEKRQPRANDKKKKKMKNARSSTLATYGIKTRSRS